MLLVLDFNEYIFAFGIFKKPACEMLLDAILDTFPMHSIRIPRLIVEEVVRHLTPEEFREFIKFVTNLTSIDEDFIDRADVLKRLYQRYLEVLANHIYSQFKNILIVIEKHFKPIYNKSSLCKVFEACLPCQLCNV